MLIGDFNAVETDQKVNDVMNLFDLKNLVREPKCFKGQIKAKDIFIDFDHLRPRDFKRNVDMTAGTYRNRLSNFVFQSNFPKKPCKQKSLDQAEA